jgi:hemoglobin
MDTVAEPINTDAPFYRLGGHEVFQAICNRFYDLMDEDPAYAKIRAMHAPNLSRIKVALAQFLAGWAGGPRDWDKQNPDRCMMGIHLPYLITNEIASQWADCMQRAIADVAPEPTDLAQAMSETLAHMARSMGR